MREESGLKRSDSRDDTEITLKEEERRRAELDKAVEKALTEEDPVEEQKANEEKVEANEEKAEKKKWWGWF